MKFEFGSDRHRALAAIFLKNTMATGQVNPILGSMPNGVFVFRRPKGVDTPRILARPTFMSPGSSHSARFDVRGDHSRRVEIEQPIVERRACYGDAFATFVVSGYMHADDMILAIAAEQDG